MSAAESDHPVITSRADGVLTLLINAPTIRNSLSAPGVLDALLSGLDELERDPGLRVAIIGGMGGNFCSGGDLRQLSGGSEPEIRARMTRSAWLYRRIALADKLVIAAVEGAAFGAGSWPGDMLRPGGGGARRAFLLCFLFARRCDAGCWLVQFGPLPALGRRRESAPPDVARRRSRRPRRIGDRAGMTSLAGAWRGPGRRAVAGQKNWPPALAAPIAASRRACAAGR